MRLSKLTAAADAEALRLTEPPASTPTLSSGAGPLGVGPACDSVRAIAAATALYVCSRSATSSKSQLVPKPSAMAS